MLMYSFRNLLTSHLNGVCTYKFYIQFFIFIAKFAIDLIPFHVYILFSHLCYRNRCLFIVLLYELVADVFVLAFQ